MAGEDNEWDFDPKDEEQVMEFNHDIQSKLSEVEQRKLLCLIECDRGLTLLRNTLYK